MIKNLRKNKKGFTLIEIIVVLVIMGILLAIAVPAILGYVKQASDAKYLSQARGGYLAAQTITARTAATSDGKTDPVITTTTVNGELGLKDNATADDDEGYVTNIKCEIANKKEVTSCNVQVTGMTGKYVSFTKTEAKVVDGAFPTN